MKRKNNTFYCFSPLVMFATFAIEISMLIYLVWRYKLNSLGRLIAIMLLLLATFQFVEYHVCENIHNVTGIYSRIGFIAITFLPALAMHVISLISGKSSRFLVGMSYASAVGISLWFGLSATAFKSYECGGNYAIFQIDNGLGALFFTYYYFWLVIGLILCLRHSIDATKRTRLSLTYQAFGYISLLIPTGIVNALNPASVLALPSVMCGFAIIYAFILVLGIAPNMLTKRRK